MGGKGSGKFSKVGYNCDSDREPWERQAKETDQAWRMFVAYRDLGDGRSVDKAVVSIGKKPNYRKTAIHWSTGWGWRMRAAAWDNHVDAVKRQAVLKDAEKKARSKLRVADGMWQTAAKGLVMWSNYLDKVMEAQAKKPNMIQPPPITPTEVQRLAEAGVKLSQLLEDKPTDIQEKRLQLSIDEKRKRMQKFIKNPGIRASMRDIAHKVKALDEAGDEDLQH